MTKQQSEYRQIIKATSIFGGVQVFSIIINIIRSKVIALLLGTTGIGIYGLLTTTISLISGLTNFGLGVSAVRDISSANSTGNQIRIARVVTVLKRWVWGTGILGVLIMLIISPILSQLTFGNKNYTSAFIWISITLLFTQLSSGQLVVLQGMRKLQYLAKASLTGSALGLIVTFPLYYLFGINGIVPSIILTSLISLLLSWFFAKKIKFEQVKVSRIRTIAEGKSMLLLGFMISLSGLFSLGASYLVRIFIGRTGGIEQVGLYTAGFAIINSYFGLIFTAMSTDYYPHLSAVAHNNKLCKQTINKQAEISLLTLSPILLGFLIFINWIIILLYSKQFVAINDMIYWAAIGMFFKASSWSISFILLAKGASKLFFWNELIGNTYVLVLNIIGFHFAGLAGLGISYMISYFLYFMQVFVLSKIKYEFSFDSTFTRIFIIQFALVICCFIALKFIAKPFSYIIDLGLLMASVWYSIVELNNRLGLKNITNTIKTKLSKR